MGGVKSSEPAQEIVVVSNADAEEVECPVCVSLLCEPVLTPCKHRFCRNCLAKSQRFQGPACPICRSPCRIPAESLEEDTALSAFLQELDPEYESRRDEAKKEREAALQMTRRLTAPAAGAACIVVSGAGSLEVNGVYVPSYVWSYRGPTLYQKPSSRIFIFRWQQRHWIIAHLNQNESFRDKQNWYYKASSFGQATPVEAGWSPISNGCGQLPAPTVSTQDGPVAHADGEDNEVEQEVVHPNLNHSRCMPSRCSIM